MSHGQGSLERGFSVNDECLVPNLQEKSLTGQRIVYDSVMSRGGVGKIVIDKRMIHDARNAYGRYKDYLEEKNRKDKEAQTKTDSKKRAAKELIEAQAKKSKILSDCSEMSAQLDERIVELKNILRS